MQVQDVMTGDVTSVSPNTTIQEAAQKMRNRDFGSLPVCDHDQLVGIVTDRDIAIRAVAEGADPCRCTVRDIMSEGVEFCYQDDDLDAAAHLMREKQIRRLVVLDRDKHLVGILALGDLATTADEEEVGETLEEISEPAKQQ